MYKGELKGGVWVIPETLTEPDFDYEEAEKLCSHRYVWVDTVKFKCHECGDIKEM